MTPHQPRVCVLPYGQRLGWTPARLPLADLHWPLGTPDGIAGQCLSDLSPDDHVLLTPQSSLYYRPTFGTRARVSVIIMEPRAVHHKHMRRIERAHRRFHRVLTSDSALLAEVTNAVFFQTGGCWVPDWQQLDLTKNAMCSLIASAKTKQAGHKLRHETVNWIRATHQQVEVMGGGYRPFGDKAEGLAPYRYSVVIENAREKNYFTEKLIDALLCNTVPIYWGCPNIDDFFDTSGMIICQTMDDIQRAIGQMSEADYAARVAALAPARARAVDFDAPYARAARALVEDGGAT